MNPAVLPLLLAVPLLAAGLLLIVRHRVVQRGDEIRTLSSTGALVSFFVVTQMWRLALTMAVPFLAEVARADPPQCSEQCPFGGRPPSTVWMGLAEMSASSWSEMWPSSCIRLSTWLRRVWAASGCRIGSSSPGHFTDR